MRMWMLPPEKMCRKHLLGEHVEIHMAVACLQRGMSLHGFLEKGLLQLHSMRCRHDKLVREMLRRGYVHRSPLPAHPRRRAGRVDLQRNLADLVARCTACAQGFNKRPSASRRLGRRMTRVASRVQPRRGDRT
jgi:hypothetical protein